PDAAARIVASVEPRRVVAGYVDRPAWARGAEVIEWWEPGERATSPPEGGAARPWTRPAEELAAGFFTPGTTGEPKGCIIPQANLCFQVDAGRHVMPLDRSCRLASILPLSHLFELTCGLLYPFSAGAEIHYVPSRRGPDIVRVFTERRITHMLAVPQL